MYYYSITIFQVSESKVREVNEILGVESSNADYWFYEVKIQDDDPSFLFIDSFLAIFEGKYEQLKEIGIDREDISFWMLYEYEDQCNMEFSPEDMAKLGKEGITLCISCWEKEYSIPIKRSPSIS